MCTTPYLTSVPLTLGIDARAAVEEPAGRGRYVRELLEALARRDEPNRYLLYARSVWDGGLDDRFDWRLEGAPDPLWHLRAARAANAECNVFLSTNSYLTAWFTTIPTILVIHDLVTFDPSLRPARRSTAIERVTLGRAVRRSAGFVTVSHATADAFGARFPEAVDRLTVTQLGAPRAIGVADHDVRADHGISSGFILAVGTIEPRKNLPRLVRAYASLPDELQEAHPLVVVGKTGWQVGETLRAIEQLGERCKVLGYVSDEGLARLYADCTVFCFPSLGEGFGLPVLEAMHAGAAVVTSDRSSLPEVGGDAVEYVNPLDERSIAAGLERLLRDSDRRKRLSERAVTRAAGFTWDRTAALTLEAVERAA
jgi:glycosyltransferase involved in cell wall biosynthesis